METSWVLLMGSLITGGVAACTTWLNNRYALRREDATRREASLIRHEQLTERDRDRFHEEKVDAYRRAIVFLESMLKRLNQLLVELRRADDDSVRIDDYYALYETNENDSSANMQLFGSDDATSAYEAATEALVQAYVELHTRRQGVDDGVPEDVDAVLAALTEAQRAIAQFVGAAKDDLRAYRTTEEEVVRRRS